MTDLTAEKLAASMRRYDAVLDSDLPALPEDVHGELFARFATADDDRYSAAVLGARIAWQAALEAKQDG